jgi:hypothetical protein
VAADGGRDATTRGDNDCLTLPSLLDIVLRIAGGCAQQGLCAADR